MHCVGGIRGKITRPLLEFYHFSLSLSFTNFDCDQVRVKSVSYNSDSIAKEKSGVRRLMANAIKHFHIFLTFPYALVTIIQIAKDEERAESKCKAWI